MNVNLINYSTQKGLILEKIEEKDSIVKKTLLDLGGIIDGTFTFGTGITAMLPAVKQLMSGSTPQLTEQDIIILYITAMWILVGKHKEKVTKLLEIIKEKGLTESLNTVFNFLESLEDVVLKIGKSLGYTANSLTDIVAFTFLAFPILDGILFLMNQGFIDYGSPTGYLKSILFGVGILGFKNIFNHIIKKLGGKLEKLDETNYLNEGVEFYDETLLMVNDVMSIVKSTMTDKNEKTYYLPEDLRNEELIYDIENYIFTIELTISRDETIEDEFNIEAYYVDGEDTIEIYLTINPLFEPESYEHIENYLAEYIRHEIRHAEQEVMGVKPKKRDNKLSGLEYYTQPHEIDAQTSGLNIRRIKQNRSFEEVVRNSIENSKKRYGLSDEEGEELYDILLNDIIERYGKESLQEVNLYEQTEPSKEIPKKIVLDNEKYKIYVPLKTSDICNIPNTKYCYTNTTIKNQASNGTPYIIEFKKSEAKDNDNLLVIDSGKIPFLREPKSTKLAYDVNGYPVNILKSLSQEKELQDFFHLNYSLKDRIKYNVDFDESDMLKGKNHSKLGELLYYINNNKKDSKELIDFFGSFDEFNSRYHSWADENEIELVPNGINVFLSEDDFKYNVLGLSNDDNYYYNLIMGNYHDSPYDELPDDELDYASCWFNNEQRVKLIEIMNVMQGTDIPLNRPCHQFNDGEINDFFNLYFPNEWDRYGSDMLYTLGYGIAKNRVDKLKKEFDDEVIFDYEEVSNDVVMIHIGWQSLLYLVTNYLDEDSTLDDLFNQPISEIGFGLSEAYYDEYGWGEETENEIRQTIDKLLETIDENENISDRREFVDKFTKFIKDEGFTKPSYGNYIFSKETPIEGNDGKNYKRTIVVDKLIPSEEKIDFTITISGPLKYDRESYVLPFEDFVTKVKSLSLFEIPQ